MDSFGNPGSASITITIEEDDPPVVTIIEPADNSVFVEGDSITFTGTAMDDEDGGYIYPVKSWSSDIDGPLATDDNSFHISTLSVGTDIITASVVDSFGNPGSASITITIEEDDPPVVTIIEPADN